MFWFLLSLEQQVTSVPRIVPFKQWHVWITALVQITGKLWFVITDVESVVHSAIVVVHIHREQFVGSEEMCVPEWRKHVKNQIRHTPIMDSTLCNKIFFLVYWQASFVRNDTSAHLYRLDDIYIEVAQPIEWNTYITECQNLTLSLTKYAS